MSEHLKLYPVNFPIAAAVPLGEFVDKCLRGRQAKVCDCSKDLRAATKDAVRSMRVKDRPQLGIR